MYFCFDLINNVLDNDIVSGQNIYGFFNGVAL